MNLKELAMEERRPVMGFPGYTVTPDGRVFSTNNSRNGQPKQLIPDNWNENRKVILCRGAKIRKYRRVKDLVLDTWGTLKYFKCEAEDE